MIPHSRPSFYLNYHGPQTSRRCLWYRFQKSQLQMACNWPRSHAMIQRQCRVPSTGSIALIFARNYTPHFSTVLATASYSYMPMSAHMAFPAFRWLQASPIACRRTKQAGSHQLLKRRYLRYSLDIIRHYITDWYAASCRAIAIWRQYAMTLFHLRRLCYTPFLSRFQDIIFRYGLYYYYYYRCFSIKFNTLFYDYWPYRSFISHVRTRVDKPAYYITYFHLLMSCTWSSIVPTCISAATFD